MTSLTVDTWMHTTMLIDNQWGGRGTGFLISRKVNEEQGKMFLVTNKHVLDKTRDGRLQLEKVTLYMNMKTPKGTIIGIPDEYPLYAFGKRLWRDHPDENVDVLAIDVTYLFELSSKISFKSGTYGWIADVTLIEENQISAGDEVVVLGYPAGLKQGRTVYPLVRQGLIATQIGQLLVEDYGDSTREAVERRGFLIDGAIIHGSSGSPVLLKPGPNRYLHGQYRVGEPTLPYLLGIVAETRYLPRGTHKEYESEYTGLGFAHDAVTIRETIECFFD